MTITYPVSLPASPVPLSILITPMTAVTVSIAPFSFRQVVQAHEGQMWQAELTYPLIPAAGGLAGSWSAFMLSLNGPEGTMLLGNPDKRTAYGVATGAPLVNGASQTGNSLITNGWTNGITNILKAGDHLQIGSGVTTRLYENLKDVNSDGSGNATLDIWPALHESPSDGATIVVSNPKGTFRLAGTENAWLSDVRDNLDFSFVAIEALE